MDTRKQKVAPPSAQPSDGYGDYTHNDFFTNDKAWRDNKRPAVIMLLVGGLTFGSFLWLRMRLVSDMPRQAYADPEQVHVAPNQSQQDEQARDQAAPNADQSRKLMDLDEPAEQPKPYSVNDASGGAN